MGIWSIPTDGSGPAVKINSVTTGEGDDLWPSLDSLPHPRLFFERLLDSRPEPRLFNIRLGDEGTPATTGTDMGQPGRQPHINPQADAILFADAIARATTLPSAPSPDHRLFTLPDAGGKPAAIAAGSDGDDIDPAWSKDGSRIAFASNRLPRRTAAGATRDYNIWFVDAAHPDKPVQVTSNSAWDDCPAWDASGNVLYFRSNRGGVWGIWKVSWGKVEGGR